jgi:hypothetical protein
MSKAGCELLIVVFEQPHPLDYAVTGVSFTTFKLMSTFYYCKRN